MLFLFFSGLKINKVKCEIADIGVPERGKTGTLWYVMY